MRRTLKNAERAIGGFSAPSKMPSLGYSIPAQACRIGARLVAVPGSVCAGCYALKGFYAFRGPRAALARRLRIVQDACNSPAQAVEFIDNFSFCLNTRRATWTPKCAVDHRFFRWHDSGDLQSVRHLELINTIAGLTPEVAHWLPTRELPTVREFLSLYGDFEPNLRVRLSANKVDARAPSALGLTGSSVHSVARQPATGAQECPAYTQDGECASCRQCWSSAPAISYLKH